MDEALWWKPYFCVAQFCTLALTLMLSVEGGVTWVGTDNSYTIGPLGKPLNT